jgi:hypothetical protein
MKKISLKFKPPTPDVTGEAVRSAPQPPAPPPPPPYVSMSAPEQPVPDAPLPPPIVAVEKEPETVDEWIFWATRAKPPRGNLATAQFYATMAQALAFKQIAEELALLNEFIGAKDEPEGGEDMPPPRFSDQLAEGVMQAASAIIEDIGTTHAATIAAAVTPKKSRG